MRIIADIVRTFWSTYLEMSPYLLFGFAVAGLLSVFISANTVEKHLGGKGIWQVIKAALFGIPLPLCSCGVIPVSASLRKHGASKGAVLSFLLSTPQTGVDSIMVTYSLLGPVFALLRPVAAFLTGIAGGIAANTFDVEDPAGAESEQTCRDECCAPVKTGSALARAARYGFGTLPRDIARPLIIGLVAAGLISVLVPDKFFSERIGGGLPGMLVMMLAGIPMYVCATASVPIAVAMIAKGVSYGAALVFLMTGPATNIAAIATVWKMLGRRAAIIYLITVAAGSLAFGLAVDSIMGQPSVEEAHLHGHASGAAVKLISGIVLAAVLGAALFRRDKH